MYIFQELDKWAYDIEITFKKEYFASPRTRKQYVTICAIRDRLYDEYYKRRQVFNKSYNETRYEPKNCDERR